MREKWRQTIIMYARSLMYVTKLDHILRRLLNIKPCIITYIDGGLASQMWQFSLGYAAARQANLPLFLDVTWFHYSGKDINGEQNRHFLLLSSFPEISKYVGNRITTADKIDKNYKRLYSDLPTKRKLFDYNPKHLPKHPIYLKQYYCNVRYISKFQQELSKLFTSSPTLTPYEAQIYTEIKNTNSCALHIRKGDFVGSIHDVCADFYYTEAVRKIRLIHPDIHLFVFSNDEPWAQRFLEKNHYDKFCTVLKNRSEHTPSTDLWLMMQCKHSIISNSGFSFIAAFLTYSTTKIIITPKYWLKDKNGKIRKDSEGAYLMDGWLVVNNDCS